MTTAPPTTDFRFVDTAVGGTHHRNKVRDATVWVPPDEADVYRTWMLFTEALYTYAQGHTSASGANPSVADYQGEGLAGFIPFDFDGNEDAGAALKDAVRVVRAWQTRYGLDLDALRPFYSGGRGIHIEVPLSLVGGAVSGPCRPLSKRVRRFALALVDGCAITTMDKSIYDPLRLWRVTNTRHGKTGRYKVPLTARELLTLSVPEIEALAAKPRCLTRPDDSEWLANPDLTELWDAAAKEPPRRPYQSRNGRTTAPADADHQAVALQALADAWPAPGNRHAAMLALIGGLLREGWKEEETASFACELAELAMGEEGKQREEEWKRAVTTTAARLRDNEEATGWPSLAELVGGMVVDQVRLSLGFMIEANYVRHDQEGDAGEDDEPEPRTLEEVAEIFQRWLYLEDPGLVYAVLGAVAANDLAGDPVWLMLVGASSGGKTEILNSIFRLPHVHLAATITEPALLSGTPKRDKAGDASGGLLRSVGAFGLLCLKDFTSILSMNRDQRAALLAALREIYDGSWTRHVGVDGGRTLHWEGKLGLVAGCTAAIDSHHAVMATMGERFLFFRLPETDPVKQATQALANTGHEKEMRADLAAAVAGLFAGLDIDSAHPDLTTDEHERLIALAALAARCRSAVERDGHTREVELILDAEAPARLAQALRRFYSGLLAIGLDRMSAWKVVVKTGMDCMPKVRRVMFNELAAATDMLETADIATRVGYPTQTARRALEELSVHHVAMRQKNGPGNADEWRLSDWARTQYERATVPETLVGE